MAEEQLLVEEPQWKDLALRAGRAFTPQTPIDARSLFSGRVIQTRRIVDVINQTGQHAILYGERGVGKTSLANVLSQFLPTWGAEGVVVIAPRINCDGKDTFRSVWRKVLEQIELTQTTRSLGFGGTEQKNVVNSASLLLGKEKATPDSVRRTLTKLSQNAIPILIIDEFDRLEQTVRRAFADLIKNLSDHAVPATVVIVGVADNVSDLIEEHQSVSRALVQIQMPRMTPSEIHEVIDKGLKLLGMRMDSATRQRISKLAKGLPHYAHLIGLSATRVALDQHSMDITIDSVNTAIKQAIEDAQQSIHVAYHSAVRSAHKDNLFSEVILACALANADQLGFFAAQDVREPMRLITRRRYEIPAFARHLNEFSDDKRGRVLQKVGQKRGYRYRFRDPLMQPFVIMQGIVNRKLPDSILNGA